MKNNRTSSDDPDVIQSPFDDLDGSLAPAKLAGLGPTYNPFSNNTKDLGVSEWLQLLILGPTLGVIRVILVLFLLIFAACVSKIAMVGVSESAPLSPWRQVVLSPGKFAARAILFVLGFYHIKVTGKPAKSREAPIMVCNHMSFIEPLYFTSLGVSHVAKKDLTKTILNNMLIALQTLLVDRQSKDSMSQTKNTIRDRALETVDGEPWPTVCIYPEGTTSNGSTLLQFKYGAFSAGVPVQPVVVKFHYLWFDPTWTWGSRFYEYRMLCQIAQHMEVEYLPVHYPTDMELRNPKIFAENVRRTMASKLNVPTSDCSAGDALLEIEAAKWELPPEAGLIETIKIQQLLNLSFTEIRLYLQQFSSLDTDKDGKLDFNEFKQALGDEVSDSTVRKLFQKFDLGETGLVNFREFIGLMIFLNDQIPLDQTIEMAFQLIDPEKQGIVTHDHLVWMAKRYSYSDITQLVKNIIPAMDPAKSGFISREQFTIYFKAHPELLKGLNKTTVLQHYKRSLDEQIFGGKTKKTN